MDSFNNELCYFCVVFWFGTTVLIYEPSEFCAVLGYGSVCFEGKSFRENCSSQKDNFSVEVLLLP